MLELQNKLTNMITIGADIVFLKISPMKNELLCLAALVVFHVAGQELPGAFFVLIWKSVSRDMNCNHNIFLTFGSLPKELHIGTCYWRKGMWEASANTVLYFILFFLAYSFTLSFYTFWYWMIVHFQVKNRYTVKVVTQYL